MDRGARIASAILLLIFAVKAHPVSLQWSAVDTAVDGTSIPAIVISYKVYWSENDSAWNHAADTAETSLNLNDITSGCYFFHVTAVRTDSNQESAPSQSLEYCYGDVVTTPLATVEPESPTGVNVQ